MKTTKYFVAALTLALFASCTTYKHTSRMTPIQIQPIETNKTIVDVRCDFKKRVKGQSDWCKSREEAMQAANYRAIVDNGIDIVVSPIYSIQVKNSRKYRAEVSGLAGYYENARTISWVQQILDMQSLSREDIENYLLLHETKTMLPYLYPAEAQEGNTTTSTQSIYINTANDNACHAQPAPAPAPASKPATQEKPVVHEKPATPAPVVAPAPVVVEETPAATRSSKKKSSSTTKKTTRRR